MSGEARQERYARDTSLDLARALAVIAMVGGHTLDALLSHEARALPAVQVYWTFRGLTAPLFLLVSGWAVTTSVTRAPDRGVSIVRARLPRILLLLGLGYLLRLPTWDLPGLFSGNPIVVRHLLAFDALHTVAMGLLFGALALAATNRPATRIALFLGLAILVPLSSGLVWRSLAGAPVVFQQSLGAGDAPFPLLPWIGYFFVGALLALLSLDRLARAVRAAALAGAGVALTAAAWMVGLFDLPLTSPNLFAWRVGQLLLVLALVSLAPEGLGRRLRPLGRASLGVYLLHLPILYGWGSWRGLVFHLGPVLSVGSAVLLALALLAGCFALVTMARRSLAFLARPGVDAASAAPPVP